MIEVRQQPAGYCRHCHVPTLEENGFCPTCRAWIEVGRALAIAAKALRDLPARHRTYREPAK